jgi:4-oxalocrotonate tautomerase
MPNITIEGPVIESIEKKRVLVKELTDAATKAFSLPKETIVVLIKENAPDNVGVAGTLLTDRR